MTDTNKLACPKSDDGAHDFEFTCDWASCTKCRYEVKTHKAVDELNAAAREIRRLEVTLDFVRKQYDINRLAGFENGRRYEDLLFQQQWYNVILRDGTKEAVNEIARLTKDIDDLRAKLAREIRRLELERDAYKELAFDNDDEIGRVTEEKDATIAELRDQLARIRVSPVPLSEARETTEAARSRLEESNG